jgi:chromosome segregation ATPase
MLEAEDIEKLKEVLATKDDIGRIDSRLGAVETGLVHVGERVGALETRFNVFDQRMEAVEDTLTVLEEKQDRVITILDKISARLDVIHQEYLVLKERDTRYERWFHQIAEKVGITLVP